MQTQRLQRLIKEMEVQAGDHHHIITDIEEKISKEKKCLPNLQLTLSSDLRSIDEHDYHHQVSRTEGIVEMDMADTTLSLSLSPCSSKQQAMT